jgi:hypothetical protein
MSKREAADALASALLELEDVNLNAVCDDDIRMLLDAKDDISDICRRLRREQHARDQREDTEASDD